MSRPRLRRLINKGFGVTKEKKKRKNNFFLTKKPTVQDLLLNSDVTFFNKFHDNKIYIFGFKTQNVIYIKGPYKIFLR